jgi:hypothetical protein
MKIVGVLSLLLSVACGTKISSLPKAQAPAPTLPPQAKDLKQMPLAAALAEKYDSAKITCKLWTQMGAPLFLTNTPNDTVSMDLLQDSTFPKVIELKGQSLTHTLHVQIQLAKIQLSDLSYHGAFGGVYILKNSPSIDGTYTGEYQTAYPKGPTSGEFQSDALILNENLPSVVNSSSGGPASDPSTLATNYIECSIDTKIKPLYADEWHQDSPDVEGDCALPNANDCVIRRK